MQPLAHVTVQLDRVGSNVLKKYVTPAEAYFFWNEHYKNSGGKPIVTVLETKDDEQVMPLEGEQAELERLQKGLDELGELDDITEEVREKRKDSYMTRILESQTRISELEALIQKRNLSAQQEVMRLKGLYGSRKIEVLFPGISPNLPASFKDVTSNETVPVAAEPRPMFIGGEKK